MIREILQQFAERFRAVQPWAAYKVVNLRKALLGK
jgi:hypothetical protein